VSRPDLAASTDRLAQAPASRYEAAPGYAICRTPQRPGYLFGNYLILDSPPDPASLPSWLDRARAAFPAESGVRDVVLQWEQPDRYLDPSGPSLAEVTSDEQWQDVVRFATAQTAEDEAWTRWRYAQYRELGTDACRWLAAVDGGEVIATGGVVSDQRLDRFQEVLTAADRRRRGLATGLCGELLRRTRRPGRLAVAVADQATGADGVYRKLGLAPVGFQYTVVVPGALTDGRDA